MPLSGDIGVLRKWANSIGAVRGIAGSVAEAARTRIDARPDTVAAVIGSTIRIAVWRLPAWDPQAWASDVRTEAEKAYGRALGLR